MTNLQRAEIVGMLRMLIGSVCQCDTMVNGEDGLKDLFCELRSFSRRLNIFIKVLRDNQEE